MKFYETHYEEYIHANEKYNIHPEMDIIYNKFPKDIRELGNLIVYGPCGVGKYTQVLKIIKNFSQSHLKYEKKIKIQTDKQTYTYRISDIHYEIDLGLLGCNSKILWNEIFQQIVDIISVKQEKKGFIVCKNFQLIHTELLEIFYSYIQQYNHSQSPLQIRFILLTEQVSFIPNNILNCSLLLSIKRPNKQQYLQLCKINTPNKNAVTESASIDEEHTQFIKRISHLKNPGSGHGDMVPKSFESEKQSGKEQNGKAVSRNYSPLETPSDCSPNILEELHPEFILNLKELYSFSLIKDTTLIPNDIFNIICDNIIKDIENPHKIVFSNFRDTIYDILIYNLDVTECLWYILTHLVKNGKLNDKMTSNILKKSYLFLKYFNNNYRPIYHLENIFYFIINQTLEIDN